MKRVLVSVSLACLVSACGGSPSGPGTPARPAVTLTFLSGTDNQPVAGATVNLTTLGRTFTTNAQGRITVAEGLESNRSIEIVATGFFVFRTIYDRDTYLLWQQVAGEDLLVREMAFNEGGSISFRGKLTRINRDVSLLLAADVAADSQAVSALQQAASIISERNARYVFRIITDGSSGPVGSLGVRVSVNALGVTEGYAGWLDGVINDLSRIELASVSSARNMSSMLHCMGHILGLNHTTSSPSFMGSEGMPTASDDLIMRMMVIRPPFATLDNDPRYLQF